MHISDPTQRPEEFRHLSLVTPYATAVVAGHGIDGYRMALERIAGSPDGTCGRDPGWPPVVWEFAEGGDRLGGCCPGRTARCG